MYDMDHPQATFWNERYAAEEYVYGVEPNAWLYENLPRYSPGKALFPCEGEGRNSVFAAALGWEVTAFDFSREGREKALRLAESRNVKIDYQLSEAQSFENHHRFHLVALIYCHFHHEQRAGLHQKFCQMLLPGGVILLEAFNQKQLGKSSGGPQDLNLLYSTALLRDDFKALDIEYMEELEIGAREGTFHRGPASIIRLLARKI